jgi:hypothetical protein
MSRMRRGARMGRLEMGEAINFEDVLTVMTVLLVLRLVFMVPLVNLDKAKTVAAQSDSFWERQALYVHTHPGTAGEVDPYRNAFELQGQPALRSVDGTGYWVEAAAVDSTLLVLRHDTASGRFSAMQANGRGHSLSFRHGSLLWSKGESEWFSAGDSIDYGGSPGSKALEKEFREWTKARRGY